MKIDKVTVFCVPFEGENRFSKRIDLGVDIPIENLLEWQRNFDKNAPKGFFEKYELFLDED